MPKRKRKDVAEPTLSPTVQDEPSVASISKPNVKAYQIPYLEKTIHCKQYESPDGEQSLIFTHGAGGTLDAPAVVNFAVGFSATKSMLCFQGSMNLQARTKSFLAIIEHEDWAQVLGGRSMGARAAVMAAHDSEDVKRLVLVSYPLKNQKGVSRDQILLDLKKDMEVLFISGDGDTMCDLDDLSEVRQNMKAKSWLVVVNGADHGMNMKPKKSTDPIGRFTGEIAANWLESRDMTRKELAIWWDAENNTACRGPWKRKLESPS
jgi:predicted alpha/beta-hydrolase family hydrolase